MIKPKTFNRHNLKVGMDVWSPLHGDMVIKKLDDTRITCTTLCGNWAYFDYAGRVSINTHVDVNQGQCLFFSKPTIVGLEKEPPFHPIFKRGEAVVVNSRRVIFVEAENVHCVMSSSGEDFMKSDNVFNRLGEEINLTK